ncbi:SOS response-associated peptidase [Enterococcus pallens]|uniref:Abasic site processing protein n=1 Tax=Enterococcus pallens ATCC BAA-351 TaxID=1158607 RepID=R2PPA3_9ENTE|nr:SOS response-associated peptidase family protein [Enterococcus pallens]EOH86342.1 hypothetical protein UAU_05264 [Enterococcus pallens ATCC BAA-351]EOU09437.1 hypothetical protein I588_05170 [Enterococcus pallens ATCC BAA-351]OJG77564.1 hypothetical protein RV10_GL002398 [Enterococcus pallens]
MCGRYFYDLDSEELQELCRKIQERHKQEKELAERIASGEVYPSNYVVTLASTPREQILPGLTRWGFDGFKKGQLIINARSETVEEKKTFKKPFQENRCIFPMSGFNEWDQEKRKFYFSTDQTIFVAGFYRLHNSSEGRRAESIILTTRPNGSVRNIHDRMPLIVNRKDIDKWILDIDFARHLINTDMPELLSEQVS